MNKARGIGEKRVSQLPNWLWSNSNVLPSMYRRIWEAVREDGPNLGANRNELLVDTKKVFPLLLTSQLPTEVLGYIWGLANQKYAGKLTEQELYAVLALVAVAQTSYPFTNLEVLHLLPGPPEPRLNLTSIHPFAGQISTRQESTVRADDFAGKHEIQSRPPQRTSLATSGIAIPGLIPNHSHIGETRIDSEPQIPGPSLLKTNGDATAEPSRLIQAQTDGKASSSHSSLPLDGSDEFSDFQSAPVSQTAPIVPNWDTKQGSAIGSRLANHNLGVKKTNDKQKKISSGSCSASKINIVSRTAVTAEKTNSVVSTGAKESIPNVERLGEMFPKCALKSSQAKTVILKDTVIRNNESPKAITGNPRVSPGSSVEKIEISPPAKLISGKFFFKDSENSPLDLMNLQQVEDKYSALRILVEEPSIVETPGGVDTSVLSQQSDDFGDFVSAEQPETFVVSSSDIIASASSFSTDSTGDLFSDFERFRAANNTVKKPIDVSPNSDATGETFGNLEITPSLDGQSFDEKYDAIVETETVVQKEDTISVNSIELGNNGMIITRSNSVPSLDLKSFLSPSVDDEQQQTENMHQLIYWEWKQYMECCVLLLQTAANVFGGITSEVILQEVMASAQGYNFLCNLAEVAAVCRRVNFSHKEMDINIMGFDDLLMDIDRIWAEMEPFYANIPIVTELPVWPIHQSENSACCALCLTVVTSGRIVYNDNNYHVTCANLWLNCVNHNLPTLRYPPSSFASHSMPITSTGNSQI